MAQRVMDKVLQKCRNAALGSIPVLYVKTGSDLLIRRILEQEEWPLVLPVVRNSDPAGYGGRPLMERRRDGLPCTLEDAGNYTRGLPEQFSTVSYPHVWVFRVPQMQSDAEKERMYEILERYVAAHENVNHAKYEILQYSVVLLYSLKPDLPDELRTYTEFIEVDYPEEEEIRSILLTQTGADAALASNEPYLSALCTDFLGFSEEEIRLTVQKIQAVASWEDSELAERLIHERKAQKMEGAVLEHCKSDGAIAGMERFKHWLYEQIEPLKKARIYQKEVGTPPPKGVLLCGIPGCGKSEAAKFTAKTLDLPLLKMDTGSLMDKYQGVSEQKMREALRLAEAMSPCVLWIDELEKGFSGAVSSQDSSSFQRMFGYMLSWMQENRKPCFIFATANRIEGLPKEFFRSGRFDALYAVYLPTAQECIRILASCMERAVRTAAQARQADPDEVQLFAPGCEEENLLRRALEETLLLPQRPVRIVIGADLQKAVNAALRKLAGRGIIQAKQWEAALKTALQECSVYGDGQENIDSIAAAYCQMLRKGFLPTADQVLFRAEDYHAERAAVLARLKQKDPAALPPQARQEEALQKAQILERSEETFSERYDQAVYNLLYDRINEIALHLEQKERERLF